MTSAVDRRVAAIATATPADRDRSVDALRAFAIGGVVLGHWLVTALVPTGDRAIYATSPLVRIPEFTPATWLLQTLALFFLCGGYGAARGWRSAADYRGWVRQRLRRLLVPVCVLVAAWAVVIAVAWAVGLPGGPVRDLAELAISPLWFLGVYILLTALAPAVARSALGVAAAALAIVIVVDTARFAAGLPQWIGWLNLVAGWLVPFALGVAWANGALAGRRTALALLIGGAAGAAALVLAAGYPASMVGVPGAKISNLNPPTLAAVAFGIAQAGAALLLRGPLTRAMRRPRLWAVVATINLGAMTVFLWHLTALALVTASTLAMGPLAGLHDLPTRPAWLLYRLAWLPAFAAALLALWALVRRRARAH